MPRTKRGAKNTVKPVVQQVIREMATDFEKQMDEDHAAMLESWKDDEVAHLQKFRAMFREIVGKIPKRMMRKTIGELKRENYSEMSTLPELTLYQSVNSTTKSRKQSVRSTRSRTRRSRSTNDDEGYLTVDSRSSSKSTKERKKAPASTAHKSRARSLSRSKLKTPAYKPIANTMGAVTPKMKPNTPQLVLRRPNMGEVALSMQGSPLMVSAMTTDHKANVNIPLKDGRLISIQPQRGLRRSELPDLDPEIRNQLMALRDNLNAVCGLR